MTLFVTGATSSIGRVLVKEWARASRTLRVLARASSNRAGLELPGVEFVVGDVADSAAVRQGMAGCEQVVHMAAIVGHNLPEAEWWRVNREGSRNVLQAASDLGVRSMVQVSTLSVLGTTAEGEVADESRAVDPRRYRTLYQKTKRAADDLARAFAAKGLPVKIVYPGFGYGCSWASSHVSMAEMTLLRMASGQPLMLLGSGKNRLCTAYYKDTVRGIGLALERGKNGDDYILGGENLTFPEIWAAIASLLGKPAPGRHIPMPVIRFASRASRVLRGRDLFPSDFLDMVGFNWSFSTAKAQRALGWEYTPFRQGMAETWADYQAGGWKAS